MLRSTYAQRPKLPPGWSEHKAPSGHLYYYNSETKQSTYQRPTAPAEVEPAANAPTAPFVPTPVAYPASQTPPFNIAETFNQNRRGFQGDRHHAGRRQQPPEDRPKHKYPIPGCEPWVLVKTKLGRRFVYNPETNESFWKFPSHVMKGVIEYDRREREKKERRERGEESEPEQEVQRSSKPTPERGESLRPKEQTPFEAEEEDSDEYEDVEVTDEEDGDLPSKKLRTEEDDKPVEFNEEDIAYQLGAMGEEYGLDSGEYGEPGEEEWEEGEEGEEEPPLTEEDSTALFCDLLDDFRINPYTPWETLIEEGNIIDDPRYTVLSNMKSRRDVWSIWSRDRIQQLKERREKEEKKDPRIPYLALLQEFATPKLYWPEFKRKYRKEPEMKDSKLSDKDRERFYRDHISRLKLPESTRKSDLSVLLKSASLQELNNSSTLDTLPSSILTDLRYISLPPKIRDPLVEAYISTLAAAPERQDVSAEEQEAERLKKLERQKREKALAEREQKVQEQKHLQRGAVMHSKNMLRHGQVEIERAMRIGKEGLKSYVESGTLPSQGEE
ncbi:hypothetical protein AJ80_00572 [Polytolypa hystricis UAMH7299]|uniref:WW domain-containing protein n=1 Tax=Polytolypa hystricis (strain UAMH7299) TaxID=1447883 RepID=A0A2B7YUN4_POLH7|nr:hypothetical protein AJ80_00572 [Polytolypa hystricis UAMH7299]